MNVVSGLGLKRDYICESCKTGYEPND